MNIQEYFARTSSRFTNEDARVIGPQLTELEKQGPLTADTVVQAAHSENSPLHRYFEWDDKKAGIHYRRIQAREIIRSIRVRAIVPERSLVPREVRTITTPSNQPARRFEALTAHSAEAARMMEAAYEDLQTWKRRYRPYVEMWKRFKHCFGGVLSQIGEFEDEAVEKGAAEEMDVAVQELLAWRDRHAERAAVWTSFETNMSHMLAAIADVERATALSVSIPPEDIEPSDVPLGTRRRCAKCTSLFEMTAVDQKLCPSCSPKPAVSAIAPPPEPTPPQSPVELCAAYLRENEHEVEPTDDTDRPYKVDGQLVARAAIIRMAQALRRERGALAN